MDPINVNISDFKTHISSYIAKIEQGQPIKLTKRNKLVAHITPEKDKEAIIKARMSIRGALKGKMIVRDSFYDPMTEEELSEWYDNPIIPENPIFPKTDKTT